MATLSDYTSGTISLANGSVTVTGTGTLFEVTRFREGDTLQIQKLTAVIASVDSDTQLPLTEPWTGTTIVDGAYRARQLGDGSRVSTQAATVIELLGNGVLMNLAELGVEEGKVPVGGPTGEYELADLVQDPNGNLGQFADLSRAPNQSLGTNNSGNLVFKNVPAEIIASDSSNTASAGWIKTGLGTRYREIVLHIDAAPTDNNVSIGLQLSTDNGSSWLSTTDDYTEQVLVVSGTSVTASNPVSPAIVSGNVASATGGGGAMMEIKISEFNQFRRLLYSASITRRVSGGAMQFLSRNGIVTPWSPFNALRIVPTSGTLAWYRIVLTGIVG
ncbi:hypothetical protein [Brucella intermedia]|uniref:hypothetical protein n=1 Tax=Brucella intermedia TaxID=94625 RepID=UPI00244D419D|nr:hypothetical protein [Brucella intermedia]WGG60524.1 hypothetical protein QA414_06360 [Brucella intermedia]